MFLAAIIAVGQVALAALVTLFPLHSRLAALLRTFAWTAALAVALFSLVPEAFAVLGWLAVGLVGAAMFTPMLLERLSSSKLGRPGRVGLELAFAGILVHRVADGVGLGAFARIDSLRADVLIALSAHAIAVESVVILKCRTLLGARSAGWRACWLALAGIFGVAVWSQVNTINSDPTPYVAALTAGVLLHVAAHDVRHPPAGREVSRWAHLVAALLGVLITQLPHDEHEAHIPLSAGYVLLAAMIALAPIALLSWRKHHPARSHTPPP